LSIEALLDRRERSVHDLGAVQAGGGPNRWPWLARLWDGDVPVGAGFLVDERHVLTCAHIIAGMLTDPPAGLVTLDFPAWPGLTKLTVEVAPGGWFPVDDREGGDLAVLTISVELPGAMTRAPLRQPGSTLDHRFRCHGFSSRLPGGKDAVGVLRGPGGSGHWEWIQMDALSQQGYAVEAGFSGAPVWDDDERAIVGMVVARDPRDSGSRVGWMIPLTVLSRLWTPLGELMLRPAAEHGRQSPETSNGVASSISPVRGLPFPQVPLVDREGEIRRAMELLTQSSVRLLTLTGPGGVGKSQLALHIARELKDHYEDVYFVDLTRVSGPAFVLYELSTVIGVAPPSDEPLLTAVHLALGERRALVVLDNFEHVIEAASMLAALLSGAPRLQVLVTSRVRLRVLAEHELAISPFQVPPPSGMSLAELRQLPAITMFVHRASAADSAFRLDDDNASTIGEICVRLDGLPLAIELAAAQTRVLGPVATLSRLSQPLDLLEDDLRDRPARQRSLRATLEWSYGLLQMKHRELFAQLAVFAGGCTLQAAEAVCEVGGAALLEAIAALMDSSLLIRLGRNEVEPRYCMLETVRQYARSVLAASSRQTKLANQHARWCERMVETLGPGAGERDQLARIGQLDRESANIRAALLWLRRTDQLERGLRLAAGVGWYWDLRGHFDEAMGWLDSMLDDTVATDAPVPPDVCARAAYEAGLLAFRVGAYDHALDRYELGLRLARAAGLDSEQAWGLHGRAMVRRERAQRDRSWSDQNEALSIFQRVGDRRGVAESILGRAILHLYDGDAPSAKATGEECLGLFRETSDQVGIASALTVLGVCAQELGQRHHASALLEEGIAIRRGLSDSRGVAASLNNLGLLAYHRGDLTQAVRHFRECLALKRRLGDKRGLALALDNLGLTMSDGGDVDGAIRMHEQSLRLWTEIGHARGMARVQSSLARARLLGGDVRGAADLIGEAMETLAELGDLLELARSQRIAAELAERDGRSERALTLLSNAALAFASHARNLDAAACLEQLADLTLRGGQPAFAARLVSVADNLGASRPQPPPSRDPRRHQRILDATRQTLGSEDVDAYLASPEDVGTLLSELAALPAANWEWRPATTTDTPS
jgi:predicted ATPase